MGFMTKNLIRGILRIRDFKRVPTSFDCSPVYSPDTWEKEENVRCRVIARLREEDGHYLFEEGRHYLYLTDDDLASLVPPLLAAAGRDTRRRVAMSYLEPLEDSALLLFMEELLARRAEKRQPHPAGADPGDRQTDV